MSAVTSAFVQSFQSIICSNASLSYRIVPSLMACDGRLSGEQLRGRYAVTINVIVPPAVDLSMHRVVEVSAL